MKLSQQQAAAILTLKEKWQILKILVESKNLELYPVLTAQQKALTQTGIELLRKYQVAAEKLLPNGIPKREELLKKQQFTKEAFLQLKRLYHSNCLKEIQKKATQPLSKKLFSSLLQQLPLQTPLVQVLIKKLQEKIPFMKTWGDFKNILCMLIAQYSLKKNLLQHYEQKKHWEYYQKAVTPLQQLQEDFKCFTQLLNHLTN